MAHPHIPYGKSDLSNRRLDKLPLQMVHLLACYKPCLAPFLWRCAFMKPAFAQEAARLAGALRAAQDENAAQQQHYAAALADWQERWTSLQVWHKCRTS